MYLHEIETDFLSLVLLIEASLEFFFCDKLAAVFGHEVVLHNKY